MTFTPDVKTVLLNDESGCIVDWISEWVVDASSSHQAVESVFKDVEAFDSRRGTEVDKEADAGGVTVDSVGFRDDELVFDTELVVDFVGDALDVAVDAEDITSAMVVDGTSSVVDCTVVGISLKDVDEAETCDVS